MVHVVVHNAASLDGRIDGFPVDVGRYYELAATWNPDVHLVGSQTLLADEGAPPADDPAELDPFDVVNVDCPLLVVPDSRGRVRNWRGLLKSPLWSRGVALVSSSTPDDYRTYLARVGMEVIEAGHDHVDLTAALGRLESDYGARTVLVDSGGTLSGVMLRAGLVDEVSVLVHPRLVGGDAARSFCRGPEPDARGPGPDGDRDPADADVSGDGGVELARRAVDLLDDGLVWLRYDIV